MLVTGRLPSIELDSGDSNYSAGWCHDKNHAASLALVVDVESVDSFLFAYGLHGILLADGQGVNPFPRHNLTHLEI